MSKVLILGAGASYGHGVQTALRPPLARDFLSPSVREIFESDYSMLPNLLTSILGLKINILEQMDIEEVYSRVEAAWWLTDIQNTVFDELSESDENKVLFALGVPAYLTAFIYDVIAFTTQWLLDGITCPYHDVLSKAWFSPGDAVINFNYDQIMYHSLKEKIEAKAVQIFHPRGKVWPSPDLVGPLAALRREPVWMRNIILRDVDAVIYNEKKEWCSNAQSIEKRLSEWCRERQYAHGSEDFFSKAYENVCIDFSYHSRRIVSPSPYKPLSHMKKNWGKIRQVLSCADEIYACGFSFRDLHFNEVIRQAVRIRNSELNLTVATRGELTFRAIQKEFEGTKVNVRLFDGWLEQFAYKYAI